MNLYNLKFCCCHNHVYIDKLYYYLFIYYIDMYDTTKTFIFFCFLVCLNLQCLFCFVVVYLMVIYKKREKKLNKSNQIKSKQWTN